MYKLYHYLLGFEPTDFTQRLVKNLMFSFSGTAVATVITFGVNILAVRLLGPLEFGKINVIASAAEFLIILPLFGLTASASRYLSARPKEQGPIVGSILWTVLILSAVFGLGYVFLFPLIARLFNLSVIPAYFTLGYAAALAFFYLVQSFFQGVQQFKKLSFLTIASAVMFVVVVLSSLFLFKDKSFLTLYYGNLLRMGLVIIFGLLFFAPYLLQFNRTLWKEMMQYGSLHMLSFFAGFFSLGTIDNLMINYYLGPQQVGLYAAYYAAFGILVSRILNTFSQVFLPMASEHGDVKSLFAGLYFFAKRWALILWIGIFALIWVLFQFYGSEYEFDWRIAALLSFNITLYSFMILLGNIATSSGVRGASFGTGLAFVTAIINVSLNALLIPRLGLFGAVIGSIAATSISLVLLVKVVQTKLIKT